MDSDSEYEEPINKDPYNLDQSSESEDYGEDGPGKADDFFSLDGPLFTKKDLEKENEDPNDIYDSDDTEEVHVDDAKETFKDEEGELRRRFPFVADPINRLKDSDESTANDRNNFIPDFKKGLPPDLKVEADVFYNGTGKEYNARDITVVSREEWGALPLPEGNIGLTKLETPVKFVNMEYTSETDTCTTRTQCKQMVREIQRRDRETLGMADIRYNFLVGGDGNVYEGRGWNFQPEPGDELPQYHGKYCELVYIGDYAGSEMQTARHTSGQFSLVKLGLKLGLVHKLFMFIRKNVCHVKLGKMGFAQIDYRTGEILEIRHQPVKKEHPMIEPTKDHGS